MSVPRAFHALTLVVVLAASLMHTSRAQADGNCGKRTATITATGHLRLNSTLDDCSDGQIEVLDERDPRRPTLYSNGHVEIPVEPTQGPRTLNIENLRDENLRDDSAWVAVWLLPSLRGADNVQLRDAAIVHEFDESTTLKLPERTSRQAGALIRVFKGIEFDTAAPEPTPAGARTPMEIGLPRYTSSLQTLFCPWTAETSSWRRSTINTPSRSSAEKLATAVVTN